MSIEFILTTIIKESKKVKRLDISCWEAVFCSLFHQIIILTLISETISLSGKKLQSQMTKFNFHCNPLFFLYKHKHPRLMSATMIRCRYFTAHYFYSRDEKWILIPKKIIMKYLESLRTQAKTKSKRHSGWQPSNTILTNDETKQNFKQSMKHMVSCQTKKSDNNMMHIVSDDFDE